MKIIDAHLHFSKFDGFDERAREAGHINSAEHLLAEFDRLGIEASRWGPGAAVRRRGSACR